MYSRHAVVVVGIAVEILQIMVSQLGMTCCLIDVALMVLHEGVILSPVAHLMPIAYHCEHKDCIFGIESRLIRASVIVHWDDDEFSILYEVLMGKFMESSLVWFHVAVKAFPIP